MITEILSCVDRLVHTVATPLTTASADVLNAVPVECRTCWLQYLLMLNSFAADLKLQRKLTLEIVDDA